MEIVFKRRLTNELLTTYLPSLLLLLMSYATSYFKSFYFEAAVTVNLSILLVTTTLFIRWWKIILVITIWFFTYVFFHLALWRNFLPHLMYAWWIYGSYLDNFIPLFRDEILYWLHCLAETDNEVNITLILTSADICRSEYVFL